MTNILGRSVLFFLVGGGGGTEDFRFDSKILTWFPPKHCSFLMTPPPSLAVYFRLIPQKKSL